jgi:hypothetical protein
VLCAWQCRGDTGPVPDTAVDVEHARIGVDPVLEAAEAVTVAQSGAAYSVIYGPPQSRTCRRIELGARECDRTGRWLSGLREDYARVV